MGLENIHVLVLPSWYPTKVNPLNGIFFKEQVLALNKHGVQVGVVYHENRSLRTIARKDVFHNRFQITVEEEDGIPTVRQYGWNIPKFKFGKKLWVQWTVDLVHHYIKKYGKPDLIHAHSVLWGGVAALRVSKLYNIPYIVTEHSSAYARNLIQSWQIPIIRDVLDSSSDIIVVGSGLKRELKKIIGNKEIKIIPNMVDTDFFTLPPKPRSKDPFTILSVAFLTENKGHDILIRAFAEAFHDRPNVVLEIGGDGPLCVKLEELAKELGVEDRVRFLGRLSRHGVREAMWRANLFVLPSYVETFGVVFIEAMATGLPVIATRSGGPEDFVTNEVGWVIPPGDKSYLRNCLLRSFDSYYNYNENSIRQYTKNNFSFSSVSQSLIKLYNIIVN